VSEASPTHKTSRFTAFTEEEAQALWEGLLFDDGVRYEPEPGSVEERLVRELEQVPREKP
jgi:hypothetical protein